MNSPKQLLGPMRVAFLVLPPVCVLLGLGTAAWTNVPINAVHLVLIFIGALAAHISVNALNEYFDFKSGLDLRTMRTPFSGGSGTLPANPAMARPALNTGLIALAVTGLIGLYFPSSRGGLGSIAPGPPGAGCHCGLHSVAHPLSSPVPDRSRPGVWAAHGHGHSISCSPAAIRGQRLSPPSFPSSWSATCFC